MPETVDSHILAQATFSPEVMAQYLPYQELSAVHPIQLILF